MHIAFACACSPVASCLQPFGWATQLRITRGRVLPKPYQTYHMLLFSREREGELQPSLLVTRLTSWRKRASPAAGRCPPVVVLQAYRSCIKHAWVMCRGARLEVSGLGRGAAQSPWFSRRRGEKKKPRSSWLNDLLRCSRSESGRPGGAPTEAHPAMQASCAWTFHQHWRIP